MPGRTMSYEYLARPVTFCGPSIRETRVPSSRDLEGHGYLSCCAGLAGACTSVTWREPGSENRDPAAFSGSPFPVPGSRDLSTRAPFGSERRLQHPDVGPASTKVAVQGAPRLVRGGI